jgi:hypothetical protein
MRVALVLSLLLLWGTAAWADEQVLALDKGQAADKFEMLSTDSHFIQFASPTGWDHTFAQELQFFGYRYGKVGNTMGTVVLWSLEPNPDAKKKLKPKEKAPAAYNAVIHSREQFKLASVPEKAGWFTVPLKPVELPKNFAVSVFTSSNANAGVYLGLTPEARTTSNSASGIPTTLTAERNLPLRRDGRNWLIRLEVRQTLTPETAFASSDLAGAKFAAYDDGTAEGFATVQRDGPMVKFSSDGRQRIKRVYLHAKLAGQWFNTDREAGVWLLDENFGILYHKKMPYRSFTNEASWAALDFPEITLPRTYYVVIEPVSRPQTQLLIGFDASGPNKGSQFGNAGARASWNIEAPEEKTNWMIRVEYR